MWSADANTNINVDFYYAAAWNNVYSGNVAKLAWVPIVNAAGQQTVTRVRVRYNGANTLYFYEFDFCEI